MKILFVLFLTISFQNAKAQMSESEVSDMCMNQIVSGMVEDKVLGNESGICVRFNKDPNGNITGMDFKMNSSAFELGKDSLHDEEQKRRIDTIKNFVLNYQKIAKKNERLTIDDIDIQVKSYADGVGGPSTYDKEIGAFKNWSQLVKYIGEDKAGLKHINEIAPQSKRGDSPVNFAQLSPAAQSAIRNIVLGKRRSETVCREFGIKNCDQRKNSGFSSPDLEKRPDKASRECADRRVSVIKVNLNRAVEIETSAPGEFHPSFSIPSGEGAEDLQADMQTAASFDIIRRHNELLKRLKDPAELARLTERGKATQNIKLVNAVKNFDGKSYSYLDFPEEAYKSVNAPQYARMLSLFEIRYKRFIDDVKAVFPEALSDVEAGDFRAFKEKSDQVQDPVKRDEIARIQRGLVHYGSENPSTDFFNFFSTSEALQYYFEKNPNTSNMVNASTIINQSNGTLDIKLDDRDLAGAKHTVEDDGRAHWMCNGGCDSGIHENEKGEFITKFRDPNLRTRNSSQINDEFSHSPLGFGSLKSLSVYVIQDCSNCDCLKQKTVSMESVLMGPKSQKISIDKVTKHPDGSRSFSKSVGNIPDPSSTCIFTPPVAHTCKVDPQGEQLGAGGGGPVSNYSCAMWDKDQHALKWTTNFVQEGLSLAQNASKMECQERSDPMRKVASSALCEQGEPDPIPVSCR